MKEIYNIFCKIYPLSTNDIDKISGIIEIVHYEKMIDFVSINSHNNYEYIVIDGVCRSYVIDFEGNDATLSFFASGDAIPFNQVRMLNGKSVYNIQALTLAKVACFNSKAFSELMMDNKEIEKWGRTVFNIELKNKVEKEIVLIALSAKDRLLQFRNRYPCLENLIPHKYIASYLGISTVSLSRLRGMK